MIIPSFIGDFGFVDDKKCPCGRTLPVIENIHGRAYDTVQSPDGRRFHGEFFMYIFEEAEKLKLGVSKFQVVQETLYRIIIKIVPSDNYKKEMLEDLVAEYVKNSFGRDVKVLFEIVSDIIREKSGKIRLIVGLK